MCVFCFLQRVHMVSHLLVKHAFDGSQEEEAVWRELSDSDAALMWSSQIGRKARMTTVRHLAQAMQQYLTKAFGYATIPGLEDILLHICTTGTGTSETPVSIQEFQVFLRRFGPLRDSYAKASCLITSELAPLSFFHRTTSRQALEPVVQRMVAGGRPAPLSSFLLRYSDSSPFVLTFYEAKSNSVQHIRIANGDLGYSRDATLTPGSPTSPSSAEVAFYPTLLELIAGEVVLAQYAASVTPKLWEEAHPQVKYWMEKVKLTDLSQYMSGQTKLVQQGPPIPARPAAAGAGYGAAGEASSSPSSSPVGAATTAQVVPAQGLSDRSRSVDAVRQLLSRLPGAQQLSIPAELSGDQERALTDALQRIFAVPPALASNDTAQTAATLFVAQRPQLRARLSVQTDALSTDAPLVYDCVLSLTLRVYCCVDSAVGVHPSPDAITSRIQVASIDLADPSVRRIDAHSAQLHLRSRSSSEEDSLCLRWQGQLLQLRTPDRTDPGAAENQDDVSASRQMLAQARDYLDGQK